jgi:hypothetical protein
VKSKCKQRHPEETFDLPVYRRPSRRGGNGGKREIIVTSLSRGHDYHRRREQRVPYIRMSGVWLQRLGIQRGHRIEITAERQRLVLTVVPDDVELPIN